LVWVTCHIAYPIFTILTLPFNLAKGLWGITCLNLFPTKSSSSDADKPKKSSSSDTNKPKKSSSSDMNKDLLNSTDAVIGESVDHLAKVITVVHNDVSVLDQSGDEDSFNVIEESSQTSKLAYRANKIPKMRSSNKRNR
jgi:hypothetical protein